MNGQVLDNSRKSEYAVRGKRLVKIKTRYGVISSVKRLLVSDKTFLELSVLDKIDLNL